jgi:hypothetical protein
VAESRFGFTVEIDPNVSEAHGGEMIMYNAIYAGHLVAQKSVLRVPPKVRTSFRVGIEIAMDDQVA